MHCGIFLNARMDVHGDFENDLPAANPQTICDLLIEAKFERPST
jgi:hypothetical protein